MKQHLFIHRTFVLAFLLILPLMFAAGSSAAEPEKGGTRNLQNLGLDQIAVESAQDTLKLCLTRIPEDASSGQLLIARQNCQQVDVERQQQKNQYSF